MRNTNNMVGFLYSFVLLFAAESGGRSTFTEFYNTYFNYPGFELWKFVNLAIFVAIFIYLAKKPLTAAFKAKRESIRAELIKAEEEKKAALAELALADERLAALDAEKTAVLQRATDEAESEKRRIVEQAEAEISKLREQTNGEFARLAKQTKAQLRKFSAGETVRLAEEKLRARIDPQKDAQLVEAGIISIGGLN